MVDTSDFSELSRRVIGCAIEVHSALGPGLLESAYRDCLCYELSQNGIHFEKEKPLPVTYKGVHLDCGYRMDIVVEKSLVIELKSVETLTPLSSAQLITYLKLAGIREGLLMNFNVRFLKSGLKRIVQD